jgi:hypothetical protein
MALAFLTAEAGRADEKPSEGGKQTFNVYGGACSRSWRLLGTYENADAALKAAAKFRTTNKFRVEVTTGQGSGSVHGRPIAYSVYSRGIRCGNWRIQETVKDRQKADDIVKSFANDLQSLEVVLHYAPVQ